MSRNGHHVTVGTPRPLADNFAPSGRPVPFKKETLKPVPGVLAQIAHIIIFSIVTVVTAFGIMFGTFKTVAYFEPVYAEPPVLNLKVAEDNTPTCGTPDYYELWDGYEWRCFPAWWSDPRVGYEWARSSGSQQLYSSALTVSVDSGYNNGHNYAFIASKGESAFMDSVTIGDAKEDVVNITGRLVVNGVDITPKQKGNK